MKFNIKTLAVVIGLCCTITAVNAVESMSVEKHAVLGIKDCITIALQNSPKIKKARYNYGIARGNVGIAKSGYFPTLGIGTGYNITDSSSTRNSVNSNVYSAEASLNQLIWNFGKTNANIRMYNFDRIAALYEFENTVLETIFGVKTNYFGVLAAKATMDVNRANVQINERNYQRTKAYFEEGIKSKIDLVNAEVYLSDSKVTLVESEKSYQNALVKLNNSMYVAFAPEYEIESTETFNFQNNYAPVSLEKIDKKEDLSIPPQEVNNAFLTSQVEKINVLDNYKFEPFPYTFDESVKLAYKNRPDLKAYDATLNAMKEVPSHRVDIGFTYNLPANELEIAQMINYLKGLASDETLLERLPFITDAKEEVEIARREQAEKSAEDMRIAESSARKVNYNEE